MKGIESWLSKRDSSQGRNAFQIQSWRFEEIKLHRHGLVIGTQEAMGRYLSNNNNHQLQHAAAWLCNEGNRLALPHRLVLNRSHAWLLATTLHDRLLDLLRAFCFEMPVIESMWMHLAPWAPSTLVHASSSFFHPPITMFLIFWILKEENQLQNKTESTCLLRQFWWIFGTLHLIFGLWPLHTGIHFEKYFAQIQTTHPEKIRNHLGQAEWCTAVPLKRRRPSCMAPHTKTKSSQQQGEKFEPKNTLTGTGNRKMSNCTQETDLRSDLKVANCTHQNENRPQAFPWKSLQ